MCGKQDGTCFAFYNLPENVEQFLDAGVCGFGVGGQLVLPDAVKTGDFAAIQARAKAFTDAIAQWEAAQCS